MPLGGNNNLSASRPTVGAGFLKASRQPAPLFSLLCYQDLDRKFRVRIPAASATIEKITTLKISPNFNNIQKKLSKIFTAFLLFILFVLHSPDVAAGLIKIQCVPVTVKRYGISLLLNYVINNSK